MASNDFRDSSQGQGQTVGRASRRVSHPDRATNARLQGGKDTDFSPSFIARVRDGVRYIIRGVDETSANWFTPGQPIAPVAPDGTQPRRIDYPVGFNYVYTPRAYEQISFAQLRQLSDGYDLMRLLIETRKDQLTRLPFRFRVVQKPEEPPNKHAERNRMDPRIPLLNEFMKKPDREHTFRTWLRAIVEDMLTIDAASILPRWTWDGSIYGFDVIDGATISRVVDINGRTPVPPDVAYRQVIHGVPAVDLMAMDPKNVSTQLIYYPRNVRPHKVYGYSPVEQVLMTINIALRRQLHQLEFYTDGTVPDCMVEMPDDWAEEQIKDFELYWNSILTGQTAERRRAKFLPAGSKVNWTKDWLLKDEMDDYIIRVMCYAFSVSPTALVKMVNRAAGATMADDAKAEGLEPMKQSISDLINIIIQDYCGYKDIEHVFGDANLQKPLESAQISAIYLDRDVITPTEVRADLGRDPITEEEIEMQSQAQVNKDQQLEIEAGTGAPGTKDKVTKQTEQTSGAPSPRGSGPRSTPAGRGEKPSGADAGKRAPIPVAVDPRSNGHSHTNH